MNTPKYVAWFLACMPLWLTLGCGNAPAPGPGPESGHAQDGHAHEHDHDHTHIAPHGGTLVELGDHAANLEFLFDAGTGEVTLYALDSHAENPVRLEAVQIALHVTAQGGVDETLVLEGQANVLTGETEDNTSEFVGTLPGLKGASEFQGHIANITVRGQTFENIAFDCPATP